MSQISIKSNKRGEEVTVNCPDILEKETLQELIEVLGESVLFKKVRDQLKIDFRATIRGRMESQTDDEFNYDLNDIKTQDYSDWVPSGQKRKSKEEKASEYLKNLDADALKSALAAAGIDPNSLK